MVRPFHRRKRTEVPRRGRSIVEPNSDLRPKQDRSSGQARRGSPNQAITGFIRQLDRLNVESRRLCRPVTSSTSAMPSFSTSTFPSPPSKVERGTMNKRTVALAQSLVVAAFFIVPSFCRRRGGAQEGPDGGDRAPRIAMRPGRRRQGAGRERLRRVVQGREHVIAFTRTQPGAWLSRSRSTRSASGLTRTRGTAGGVTRRRGRSRGDRASEVL
jgi:hypothetical protein